MAADSPQKAAAVSSSNVDDSIAMPPPPPSARKSGGSRDSSGDHVVEKGITVLCRVRPHNEKELTEGSTKPCVNVHDGANVSVYNGETFSFDSALGPESKQEEVYELVAKQIVDDYMKGFNGTIFAYGQTGSGKTHTMAGNLASPDDRGLVPRVIAGIFDKIEESSECMQFEIKVSYVEIYNEKVKCLISDNKEGLKVRERPSGETYVEGAAQCPIQSEEDVFAVLEFGAANRAIGETQMNKDSSRSHSIFIMQLVQTNTIDGTKKMSKLNMVDLAGSESVGKSGAVGQTLEEAKGINKSLASLTSVIHKLSEAPERGPREHVPYRDSKLTFILKDALGGNCRTALIVCCSPAQVNAMETTSTLKFGRRAKAIKNKAKVNQEASPMELKKTVEQLQQKNRELFEQLRALEEENKVLSSTSSSSAEAEHARQTIVELQERYRGERERADRAQQELRDAENRHSETVDELSNTVDELRAALAAKDKDLKLAVGGRTGLSSTTVTEGRDLLTTLEEEANTQKSVCEGEVNGEEAAQSAKRMADIIKAFKGFYSEKISIDPEIADKSSGWEARREQELEALIASSNDKYEKLLATCTDEYTKARLMQVEESNMALRRKATEDAQLLEARELEIRIYEKKVSQKNQRVQILEILLNDARNRNEKARAQVTLDGGDGGSRRVINSNRHIYGGKANSARVAQIQESLTNDTNSPVTAVRDFITKITGRSEEVGVH